MIFDSNMKKMLLLIIFILIGTDVTNYLIVNEELLMCLSLSAFFIICIYMSKQKILIEMYNEIKIIYLIYYYLFKINENMISLIEVEINYIAYKLVNVIIESSINLIKMITIVV